GGDLFPRAVGQRMSEDLGQPVVFENKPGASGTLGMGQAANATPDGYTLGATAPGTLTIYPNLAKVDFDPLKDLIPVGTIATSPHIISVPNSLPVKSVRELVDYIKARPGAVNFGSTGATSLARLSAEIFNNANGLKAVHVPYQGGTPAA